MNIRKVIAGSLAALAAGATLAFGVMGATTLDQGLKPFVKTDTNALESPRVVVGDAANPMDILGSIDVATAFTSQYATKTETIPSTAGVTTVSGEGYLFSKSADKLNVNESLYDVTTTITNTKLPTTLKAGVYKDNKGTNRGDREYTQRLVLTSDSGQVTLVKGEYLGKTEPDLALKFDEDKNVYQYELNFKTRFAVANPEDIKDTYIDILGSTYLITNAEVSSGTLTSITVMSGKASVWVNKGETKTIDGHDVSVYLVDGTNLKCGVTVDGSSAVINKGETETLAGVTVGVLDLVSEGYAGGTASCQIYIGANEIKLTDGEAVKKEGVEIEGSSVTIDATGGLKKITITYAPPDEDVYVQSGESYTDPIFGAFKFKYVGENPAVSRETIKLEPDGSTKYKLTLKNTDGYSLTFDAFYKDGNNVKLGKDSSNPLYVVQGEDMDYSSSKKPMFVVEKSGYSYLLQVDNVDEASNQIDFRELFSGQTFKDQDYNPGQSTEFTFLDQPFNLTVDESADTITLDDITDESDNNAYIITEKGAKIFLDESNSKLHFIEETGLEQDVTGGEITVTMSASGEKLDVSSVDGVDMIAYENVDKQKGGTQHGTVVIHDYTSDQDKVYISYPDEPAYYDVAILGEGGDVKQGGGTAGGTYSKAIPIYNSISWLASEVPRTGLNNDLILVGGPCANAVVRELLNTAWGVTDSCGEWYTKVGGSGKGLLRVVENVFGSGKKALIIAGTDKEDTRALCKKVMKPETFTALSGSEWIGTV